MRHSSRAVCRAALLHGFGAYVRGTFDHGGVYWTRQAPDQNKQDHTIGFAGESVGAGPSSGQGGRFELTGAEPFISGVAGRYATALFDLASDGRSLNPVEKDLTTLQELLDGSNDLRRLVTSPVYSAEDQARAVAAILEKVGIKGLVANFILLIVRNRRLFVLPDIIRAFRQLLSEKRGEVTADVTSASALSDTQIETLNAALKASMGKTVQLTQHVDQSLLGGLIVKVGSRMVDGSLQTKLRNLRLVMKEVG